MKNILILIVLVLIGGGAYLYFQEPEKFKEITDKVTDQVQDLIAGSDWKSIDKYSKEFEKAGLEEGEEQDTFVGNLKDQFTVAEYTDPDEGVLKLAHDGSKPQAMLLSFPETSEGDIASVAKVQWKHFFGQEVEFLESGDAATEYAEGSWITKSGKIEIQINRPGLEKLPPVKEMPKEVQAAISDFRGVVQKKVDMENRFDKLDDEKHFCFDKTRFNEIVSEMDGLKKQAEELKKKAKELMAKIPEAQVALIRKELDGASLE